MEALRTQISHLETQMFALKAGVEADLAIIRAHKDAKIAELNAEIRDLKRTNQDLMSRVTHLEGQMASLSEKVNDLFEAVYLRLHGAKAVVTAKKSVFVR